jgi:hypothetical protein
MFFFDAKVLTSMAISSGKSIPILLMFFLFIITPLVEYRKLCVKMYMVFCKKFVFDDKSVLLLN